MAVSKKSLISSSSAAGKTSHAKAGVVATAVQTSNAVPAKVAVAKVHALRAIPAKVRPAKVRSAKIKPGLS